MANAICPKCKYYQFRPKPVLFTQSDLQSSKVLEVEIKGEEEEKARRILEEQRLQEGTPFDYEPYYYPWCAACTPYDPNLLAKINSKVNSDQDRENIRDMAEKSVELGNKLIQEAVTGDAKALDALAGRGGAKFNPITGEIIKLYTPCAYVNSTGQCPLFEPRLESEK